MKIRLLIVAAGLCSGFRLFRPIGAGRQLFPLMHRQHHQSSTNIARPRRLYRRGTHESIQQEEPEGGTVKLVAVPQGQPNVPPTMAIVTQTRTPVVPRRSITRQVVSDPYLRRGQIYGHPLQTRNRRPVDSAVPVKAQSDPLDYARRRSGSNQQLSVTSSKSQAEGLAASASHQSLAGEASESTCELRRVSSVNNMSLSTSGGPAIVPSSGALSLSRSPSAKNVSGIRIISTGSRINSVQEDEPKSPRVANPDTGSLRSSYNPEANNLKSSQNPEANNLKSSQNLEGNNLRSSLDKIRRESSLTFNSTSSREELNHKEKRHALGMPSLPVTEHLANRNELKMTREIPKMLSPRERELRTTQTDIERDSRRSSSQAALPTLSHSYSHSVTSIPSSQPSSLNTSERKPRKQRHAQDSHSTLYDRPFSSASMETYVY